MSGLKLLILASPYEADRIRRAAGAAGAVAIATEPHDDFGRVLASVRPDAAIVASGAFMRDPLATVQRLRGAALPGRTPLLFLGEPAETSAVGELVDEALARPATAEALVSRAIALALPERRPAPQAPPSLPPPDPGVALRRVAASIDEALDTEMLTALRTVVEPRPRPAPPPAASNGAPDALDSAVEELMGALPAAPVAAPAEQLGDLGDEDMPALLGRAFAEGVTGRVTIRRAGIEKAIYLEAGRPVFATSNSPEDRFVEMLVREGRLDPSQYQAAVRAADETGRRMGALLIDLGVLKSTELLPAIRRHYEEIVTSIFAWTAGRWRIEPGVMASPKQTRLLRHPAALVREGLRRGYQGERLWARLGSGRNVFRLEQRAASTDVLAALIASDEERRVPLLFDGVRPVDEVVRASGLPPPTVGEIALVLWVFDLLHPAAGGEPRPAERGDPRDREIERERIRARHALVLDGDYFQILGVPRGASAHEIRRAYDRLLAELQPEQVGPELTRELGEEIQAIRDVAEEALRVLGSAGLREQYQAHLRGDGER